jgi:energy-converting hydrogenase Eha subunit A
MISIIVFIVFLLSLIVLAVIVFRKMPLLLQLPEAEPSRFSWKESLMRIKDLLPVGNFSFEIFLQKILSRIRVLTLKTDNKTSGWLQKLRERGQKRKFDEDDNYWREIRNHTRK